MDDILQLYIDDLQREVRAGKRTEHTYRPALKRFIEGVSKGRVIARNEAGRVECGAPDFTVSTTREGLTIGYIEAKDIGVDLAREERSDQLRRYRGSLSNLVLTDYLQFRWYVDGESRGAAQVATIGKGGRVARYPTADKVGDLLAAFLGRAPVRIVSPKELAQRLAQLAHMIRDMVTAAFGTGKASSVLADLREALSRTLIPDIGEPKKVGEFADIFAQTLVYGLFAARLNHTGPHPFQRSGAAAEVPKTNPFLRKLFSVITGPDLEDEPFVGFVDDVVQVLAHADMARVLQHFGRHARKQDPIVHFYETFLATYDPRVRELRGVYYTPDPVVSYIVESVDRILRQRFALTEGLADTTTVKLKPPHAKRQIEVPSMLILDPACGTGTFLYHAIAMMRAQFIDRDEAGMWSGYVTDWVLPRVFGFELLMAPYAIAHIKLGMQLAGLDLDPLMQSAWKYDLSGRERLGVYLTNSLEEIEHIAQTRLFLLSAITEEAAAATRVKKDLPILVVMGNPPYSGHSANRSWHLVDGQRQPTFIGGLIQDYYYVDGQPLKERNPKWLQDDYVKFIRWGQWRIEQTGQGILGFITNHGYLDNPTFRGMRQHLAQTFTDIFVLNLHGNFKKREKPPDGGVDQNVFDIQQGVAIGIFVKEANRRGPARVHYADLWGQRTHKYTWLESHDLTTTKWTAVRPTPPFYAFTPQPRAIQQELERAWKISDAMPVNVLGFQTHRDRFAVAFDEETVRARVVALRDDERSDEQIRQMFDLADSRGWQLHRVRDALRRDGTWEEHIIECLYRPFDWRYCYFSPVVMDRPRRELIDHVEGKDNLVLGIGRQGLAVAQDVWYLVTVATCPVDANIFRRGGVTLFPLYLYHSQNSALFSDEMPGNDRGVNFAPAFVEDVSRRLGLPYLPTHKRNMRDGFGPIDLLGYIYAIVHSFRYRTRYAELLKTDFPRIPLTSRLPLFRALAAHGEKLITLHLMSDPSLNRPGSPYRVKGEDVVADAYPQFIPSHSIRGRRYGRVFINPRQYFDEVPEETWRFDVGGFQPAQRWLKDRRGRQLGFADRLHYRKILAALSETRARIREIDKAIGDWPLT